jgi:hypothetical protein
VTDVVARACELLADRERKRVPLLQLVNESGFREAPALLTTEAATTYLGLHQELIQPWLIYSMNKRASKGWYIVGKAGQYEVGYVPIGQREVLRFEDRTRACAEFVVREVREIASMFPR